MKVRDWLDEVCKKMGVQEVSGFTVRDTADGTCITIHSDDHPALDNEVTPTMTATPRQSAQGGC